MSDAPTNAHTRGLLLEDLNRKRGWVLTDAHVQFGVPELIDASVLDMSTDARNSEVNIVNASDVDVTIDATVKYNRLSLTKATQMHSLSFPIDPDHSGLVDYLPAINERLGTHLISSDIIDVPALSAPGVLEMKAHENSLYAFGAVNLSFTSGGPQPMPLTLQMLYNGAVLDNPVSYQRMVYPTYLRMIFVVPSNGAMDNVEIALINEGAPSTLQLPYGLVGGHMENPSMVFDWTPPAWMNWDLLQTTPESPDLATRPFAESGGPPPMRFSFKTGTAAGTYTYDVPILVMANPPVGEYPLRVEYTRGGEVVSETLTLDMRKFVGPIATLTATPSTGPVGTTMHVVAKVTITEPYLAAEVDKWQFNDFIHTENVRNLQMPAGFSLASADGEALYLNAPLRGKTGTFEVSFDLDIVAAGGGNYKLGTTLYWAEGLDSFTWTEVTVSQT